MTAEAKAIYEALLEHGPLDTIRLRREARMSAENAKSRFERALVELQVGLKVLPIGVTRTGAWRYAFIYEIVQRHFPELPAQSRPITRAEADAVASQMLQVTRPELIKVIVNKDDQVVGFLLAFINVGKALQRCGGRLFPFGWIHLLRELRTTEYLDVNGMGILEEYRGLGGNIIMYHELYNSLHQGGDQFKHADMTQMADFVVRMLSDANTLGGNRYKVHRVYRKVLD